MIPDQAFPDPAGGRPTGRLDGTWRKSSLSGPYNDACVEARCLADNVVEVRDSHHPRGPVLSFTGTEWDAFIVGVKDGQFDRVTA